MPRYMPTLDDIKPPLSPLQRQAIKEAFCDVGDDSVDATVQEILGDDKDSRDD